MQHRPFALRLGEKAASRLDGGHGLGATPADLSAAARPESVALVAAFLERDESPLGLNDVRNLVHVVEHSGLDAAVGSIRSVLDVLRLLDEFR